MVGSLEIWIPYSSSYWLVIITFNFSFEFSKTILCVCVCVCVCVVKYTPNGYWSVALC